MLKKYKLNEEIEFAPVYFNSETKTVINHRFRLENSFQKLLYIIDVWINKGSGWNVESIESQYINISKLIKSLLSISLILKKLQKKIKSFLVILIMMELSFPCNKKILARLRWKKIYALTCLVMKMSWFFQFMFQIKNLKTHWICCF